MLKRYEFTYPLAADEVKARLESAASTKNAEIVTEFNGDRVKVYQEGGVLYNSFNPVFAGTLRPRAAGAVLSGYFRFNAFILVFVAILIGLSLYNLVEVLRMPEHVPGHTEGWKAERLAFELQFLVFAIAIPVVGWLIGLRTRRLLLSVIQQSAGGR